MYVSYTLVNFTFNDDSILLNCKNFTHFGRHILTDPRANRHKFRLWRPACTLDRPLAFGFKMLFSDNCSKISGLKPRKWTYFSQMIENQNKNAISFLDLLKLVKECAYTFLNNIYRYLEQIFPFIDIF